MWKIFIKRLHSLIFMGKLALNILVLEVKIVNSSPQQCLLSPNVCKRNANLLLILLLLMNWQVKVVSKSILIPSSSLNNGLSNKRNNVKRRKKEELKEKLKERNKEKERRPSDEISKSRRPRRSIWDDKNTMSSELNLLTLDRLPIQFLLDHPVLNPQEETWPVHHLQVYPRQGIPLLHLLPQPLHLLLLHLLPRLHQHLLLL